MADQVYLVRDIIRFMEEYAPPELAEKWDHVGLQIGDKNAPVHRVVVALDPNRKAMEFCLKEGADLLLTHHPLFLNGPSDLDYSTPKGALVRDFILNRINVYSAHTNLDKTLGGVNHVLAEACGIQMPMSIEGVPLGLFGELMRPIGLFELAGQLKSALGAGGVMMNTDENQKISRVFVSGGSFDEHIIPFLAGTYIDAVISGEIKYHPMQDLRAYGIAALSLGHDVSERVILKPLAQKLHDRFPGIGVAVDMGFDYNKVVF